MNVWAGRMLGGVWAFRLSLGLSLYYHHYYSYLAATGAHEMDFTLTKLRIRGSFVTKLDFFIHALSLLDDKMRLSLEDFLHLDTRKARKVSSQLSQRLIKRKLSH